MLQFGCDVVQNTGKEVYCARLFALGWVREDDRPVIGGDLVDGLVPAV